MIIYQTPPIDFFDGLMPIDYAVITFQKAAGHVFSLFQFVMSCARTVAITSGNEWDGDIIIDYLYMFAIPDEEAMYPRMGLVWKQQNNGTTFICSPVEIPWLSQYALPNAEAQGREASPGSQS